MVEQALGHFIVAMISFMIYNYLTFILVGSILEKPRLTVLGKVFISIINSFFVVFATMFIKSTAIVFYLLLFIVFFVEFYLLHRDSVVRVLFVTLACLIHVMAIRSICVAVLATCFNFPFYLIVQEKDYLLFSSVIVSLVLNVATLLVLKFIPALKVKIINQHNEQLWFMTTWLLIFNGYLIINARVYDIFETHSLLNIMQIVTPTTIMLGVYIVLLFSMRTGELLGYKDKNSELEVEIQREQQYRRSMFRDSIAIYEFNLSNDEMTSDVEKYREMLKSDGYCCYSELLKILSEKLVHPEDRRAYMNSSSVAVALQRLAEGKMKTITEYRRLTPNGNYIWVKSVTNLVEDVVTGDVTGFTYVRNINDEKEMQIELRFKAERDQLTGLLNKFMTANLITEYLLRDDEQQHPGALFVIDIDNFKSVNDGLGHIFGDVVLCDLSERLSNMFRDCDIIGRVGGDEFMVFMKGGYQKAALEAKASEICKNFCNRYSGDSDGAEYAISASVGIAIYPIHGNTFEKIYKKADTALYASKNKGKDTYTLYEGADFIEYKADRLDYDALTAGMSFETFKLLAADMLAKNVDGKQLLARLDINDFRVINGMHGFEEGDKILKNMARSIEQTIASTGIFSRMSNDNFIVLANYQDELTIQNLTESFKENFGKLNYINEKSYSVDFTCGIVKIEKSEKDIILLIEKATMAHRAAKKSDGISMFCYDETLRDNAVKQKSMENTMHSALATGRFNVYLQPKYDLRSEVMVGAEALIRWMDNTDTIIQPSEFVPLFEKNGFIIKIDLFVLEQVCQLQRNWIDRGITPVVISVNQSKRLVSMADYVNIISEIVQKYDIDPCLIELELTETIIHDNIIKLRETLDSLKKLGFIISIDDFGSGYSSLGMLKEIHADVLKIDREFLKKSEQNERGEIVLLNVIRLAKELKMSVVAEGVETKKQAKLLSSLDCDSAQGFLYARPMPILDFEKRLLDRQENTDGI